MGTLVSSILTGGAVALAIPVIAFFLEIIAAVAVSRQRTAVDGRRDGRTPIAVLVPAHNESIGILPTLTDIKRQLLPGDRVLVVADNCSDDTAAVASAAGAQVIERRDAERVGKGYALDFGVRHFSSDPPAIIIFVDADCGLAANSIDHLVRACTASGRPVQAQYLMVSPKNAGINSRVAEFAWRVKNWMRPLGLSHLGLPCQLMGTGMAFPWHVIRSADLAQGLIVEDLQLGLDLAKAGHAPIFCPFARVTSEFASSAAGVATQRARWEHGHIQTILKMVPALLWQSIKGKNTELLALNSGLSCSSTFAIGHAYGRNVLTWIAWRAFRLFEARCVYQHRKHLEPSHSDYFCMAEMWSRSITRAIDFVDRALYDE